METTPAAPPRRSNRRGVAAREKLLSTALEMLGTGRPETVSINMVAKQAGLSWGSVQNLFGDSDGFWSAVVELIIDAGPGLWAGPESDTVAGRVAEVADRYRTLLDSPYAVAVETVRAGLPHPLDVLARTHPRTADSIRHLDDLAARAFAEYFENLEGPGLDQQRTRDVCEVLPALLRGLRTEQRRGSDIDLDRAHRTVVTALTVYLEG